MSNWLGKIDFCYSNEAFLPRHCSFGIYYFIIYLPISLSSLFLSLSLSLSLPPFSILFFYQNIWTRPLVRAIWERWIAVTRSLSPWLLEKNPPRGWAGRDRWRRTRLMNTSGSIGGVEGQKVHLDLPARFVRCRNDVVSQRRWEAVVCACAEHGFGIRWKGGGGGRRVGLILLFQCGGRRVGGGGGRWKGLNWFQAGIWVF